MKKVFIYLAGKIANILSKLNRLFLIKKRVYLMHHQDLSNLLPLINNKEEIIYFSLRFDDSEINSIPGNHKLYSLRNKINYLSLFFRLSFYEKIILNDSTNPIGVISFSPKQKIIQLWHACGAFKKFGHESHHNKEKNEDLFKMYSKYTSIIVSSDEIRQCYAKSFSVSKDRVLALGLPRTDIFYNDEEILKAQSSFYSMFPSFAGKEVILYAPTFRQSNKSNHYKMMNTISVVSKNLSSNQVLIYSLHPFEKKHIINSLDEDSNFTNKPISTQDLLLIASSLITDYSSVIFDYCLLDKPMFFFPYDLDSYESKQRGFYYPYSDLAPGPICFDTKSLSKAISLNEDYSLKRKIFKEKFMSACDGYSTQRLESHILV